MKKAINYLQCDVCGCHKVLLNHGASDENNWTEFEYGFLFIYERRHEVSDLFSIRDLCGSLLCRVKAIGALKFSLTKFSSVGKNNLQRLEKGCDALLKLNAEDAGLRLGRAKDLRKFLELAIEACDSALKCYTDEMTKVFEAAYQGPHITSDLEV